MTYQAVNMFSQGEDLPLFSGATPNAHLDPFRPVAPAALPVIIRGIICHTCRDTGRIGSRFCFCKAGDRAAQRENERTQEAQQ